MIHRLPDASVVRQIREREADEPGRDAEPVPDHGIEDDPFVFDDQQGERAERGPGHGAQERRDPDVLDVGVEVRVLEPPLEALVLELQRPRAELGCLIEEGAGGTEHALSTSAGRTCRRLFRGRHGRAWCHRTSMGDSATIKVRFERR